MGDGLVSLLWEIAGGWIRAGLAAFGGYLVAHHILTAPQGDRLTSELLTHLEVALPIIMTALWTAWAKSKARTKLETALNAAGLDEADVVHKISIGQGAKLFALVLLLATWSQMGYAQTVAACSTDADGHQRWALKTRPAPDDVQVAGDLIVADVIGWDVPHVPRSDAIVDASHESKVWRLTGYVRLAKLSMDDCDIHLQLADKASGKAPEVIVEIPMNQPAARKAIAGILNGVHSSPHTFTGSDAPKIVVEGYGFIDQEHATKDGNKKGHAHGTADVATIYELHPCFKVELAGGSAPAKPDRENFSANADAARNGTSGIHALSFAAERVDIRGRVDSASLNAAERSVDLARRILEGLPAASRDGDVSGADARNADCRSCGVRICLEGSGLEWTATRTDAPSRFVDHPRIAHSPCLSSTPSIANRFSSS